MTGVLDIGFDGMTALHFLWAIMIAAGGSQSAALAAVKCETVTLQQRGSERVLEVGQIWSGVYTGVGVAEPAKGTLLVVYYDADRWVTLAKADAASGKVCRMRLGSRFPGWDAHNSLVLAIARDGSMHVAGNAHATPLFYAHAGRSDLSSVQVASVVGRDKDRATYPIFRRDAAGDLILFYRSGGSGDGMWIADRWSSGRWQRVGPAFAARDEAGSHISAYLSPFMVDQSGTSHAAIVWRRTSDVASNFAVGYAKTVDFKRWSGGQGAASNGPVRPDQIDIVDAPGENAGLLNNARLILSSGDQPVIFYTRYGARGTDALIAARRTRVGWDVKEIASSDHRTPIKGEGSLPGAPIFLVSSTGNIGNVSVAFPNGPRLSLRLDLDTLDSVTTASNPSVAATSAELFLTIPKGLANPVQRSQPVTASGFDGGASSRLIWYTQSLNRDHAWTCTTRFPLACTPPPSPLLWVVPTDR